MKSSKYITTIDAGGNEGVMRRRPPNSSKILCNFIWIFILVFALLVEPLNGKPINGKLWCRHNEITVGQCDSRSCTCITCPTCPPGQGLLPLCGTSVIKKEEIQCVPCKIGTFSSENSTQSCQPCHQCDGQKTLRNCTSMQNTECSIECMDGYVKDVITERCEEGIPPPPAKNTVQSITTSGSTKSKKQVVESTQIPTTEKNDIQTKITGAEEEHNTQYVKMFTSISTSVFVFFAVVYILYKIRKNIRKLICCSRCKMSATDEQSRDDSNDSEALTPMNPTGSDTSSYLEGMRLKDISPNLMKKITVKISDKSKKGWEEIGNKYEISNNELEDIKTRCSWSEGKILPGRLVLEILSAIKPNLTLKEFIGVLKSLKRKDVICDIKEEYNQPF